MNKPKVLSKYKNIHFIGIGGEGMCPIAKVMLKKSFRISGSDMKENINTIRLKDMGATVYYKHNKDNIRTKDVVITSTAIPEENIELQAAINNGIPVLRRAEALSWLMDSEQTKIAVAGTHGKTTTSSMIAQIFKTCKANPTFVIGGEISGMNTNCALGNGEFFIAEADESDGSLLMLNPNNILITNIEAEHLDYYRDIEHIKETFYEFIKKLPKDGKLFLNLDNEINKELMQKADCNIHTYGFDNYADIRAENISQNQNITTFDVIYKHKKFTQIELQVPGAHNVSNALGAMLVALEHNLPIEPIKEALFSFTGSKKRFQLIGEENGIIIYDDYAHHPTEIKATLNAAKEGWPEKRKIVVFQPHRFSRTKHLLDEFATCFKDADIVIVTNIYKASETPLPGISGEVIANNIKDKEVYYINKKDEIPQFLMNILKTDDMVLTMGAGDIHKISKETIARLKHSELIIEDKNDKTTEKLSTIKK